MEKRRDNQWKTMAISGIETQGSKVRKLCIEVLGFSNDGIEKEFKETIYEMTQEAYQHLVAINVKCLTDQNKFYKAISSMNLKDRK